MSKKDKKPNPLSDILLGLVAAQGEEPADAEYDLTEEQEEEQMPLLKPNQIKEYLDEYVI